MPLTSVGWNVVVLGYWNRAILTPSGIVTRLFGLSPGTPVGVLLAVDAVAPPKVEHDDIAVVVSSDRLIVQPHKCDFITLQRAKEIAGHALNNLHETPVIAAGINVKYTCDEPLEMLQQVMRHESLDCQLSDCKYEILGRTLTRSLKFGDGQINFSMIEESSDQFTLQLNFHRGSSSVPDLESWLATPIESIESHVNRILQDCMYLEMETVDNVAATAEA